MIADEPTMTIPLRTDEHGAIRIGNTRVTLDSIINFYLQGESPEDLHAGFPTVPLSDIYAVIAYYLSHRAEVDSYLKRRNDEAEQIIKDIEANLTPEARALRTRLRAFQEQQKYGPCSGS
jgi:uncharacterized protein (DUF433 family)